MVRRDFLRATGALSAPLFLNGLPLSAAPSSMLARLLAGDNSDRVLVLVQLNGGNDGLNTVIPLDQYDNLANVRSNIMLPQSQLLKLTDTTALHGSMRGLRELFDEGMLNIVQAAGYPDQNRSHFRSTDIWQSGSPSDEFWNDGWLGRHMDTEYPGFPEAYPNPEMPDPIAITMGNVVSETCQGMAANFSLTLTDPFSITPLLQSADYEVPATPYGSELQFLRTTIVQTNAYATVVESAANRGRNAVEYPSDNRLANQLKNVALLVAGGLRTKVYVVSLGGFDTHANQVMAGDTGSGSHAGLLATLSEAITVFQRDLRALGLDQRVVGMTFSEFGRRIRSNDSNGTDHGTAAPLLLFGGCVSGGTLGQSPTIDRAVDNKAGVAMQHDFRDVYGSILLDWFGVEESAVRELLYNDFTRLPIINACNTPTSTTGLTDLALPAPTLSPNPYREQTWLSFTTQEAAHARLTVYDALGSEVTTVFSKQLAMGIHRVPVETALWPTGVYFFRLQVGDRFATVRTTRQ